MKCSISVLLVLVTATARAQLENRQAVSIPDYVTKYGIFCQSSPQTALFLTGKQLH
jgi:hypothetical protein